MTREKVSIRRAPKIWSFILTGALAGLIFAWGVTSWTPVDPAVGLWATLGFFSVFGFAIGGIIGGGIGLIADRKSTAKRGSGVASVTVVSPKK